MWLGRNHFFMHAIRSTTIKYFRRPILPLRYFATAKSFQVINVPKYSSISHLATLLKTPFPIVQKTMRNLGFTNTNWDYIVDNDSAGLIADELGFKIKVQVADGENLYPQPLPGSNSIEYTEMPSRPPVVAIMGHVDHGKTTLLDYFRKSHIVNGEKGGITQHIGAFLTQLGDHKVCFLDTPGHEAFLKLRERGAHLTDFILLIVAADDSVMPQTKEAITHAKSAGVPMVVAVTKCDKIDSNYDKVIADLATAGVDVEPYGGETQCVKVSAVTGEGMPELISCILAQSEIQDVKAPQKGFQTEGVIVESSLSKGQGPTASLIVKKGILIPRQYLVAGTAWCRVRQITNERGSKLNQAFPGIPVSISGWKGIPEPGDVVLQAKDEHQVKRVIQTRERILAAEMEEKSVDLINEIKSKQIEEAKAKEQTSQRKLLGLDSDQDKNDQTSIETKKAWFLIKADTVGSSEALADIISQFGNKELQAAVLLSGVGSITESDIFRAENSDATIISFATQVSKAIERLAEQRNVKILKHDVIYRAMQEVSALLSSQLAPIITKKVTSSAEIKDLFSISLKGKSKLHVAGVKVTKGTFVANMLCQISRGGKVIYEGKIENMQHGKEHVSEARKNSEYGFTFKDWDDFAKEDIIEGYEEMKTPRYL